MAPLLSIYRVLYRGTFDGHAAIPGYPSTICHVRAGLLYRKTYTERVMCQYVNHYSDLEDSLLLC